jgi:hypothetical protein
MTRHFTELLTRCCLLISKLPRHGGRPTSVVCQKCGTWLGCVANKAGVLTGQFEPDLCIADGSVAISTVLVSSVLIANRTVNMKCMQCGYVTRWRS